MPPHTHAEPSDPYPQANGMSYDVSRLPNWRASPPPIEPFLGVVEQINQFVGAIHERTSVGSDIVGLEIASKLIQFRRYLQMIPAFRMTRKTFKRSSSLRPSQGWWKACNRGPLSWTDSCWRRSDAG